MNWTKGFFRIWLVGTIEWFLVTGITAAHDIAIAAAYVRDCTFPGSGPWCEYMAEGAAKFRAVLLIIVVPPLVVLATGVALFWVVRGFKSRNPRKPRKATQRRAAAR